MNLSSVRMYIMSLKKSMGSFPKKLHRFLKEKWKRILVWCLVAVACGYCSHMTLHLSRYGLPGYTTREFFHACEHTDHTCKLDVFSLKPGEQMEQLFTAGGNIAGHCEELYLELDTEQQKLPARISVELRSERTGEILAAAEQEIQELPEDGILAISFAEPVVTGNGEDYRLSVANPSETEDIIFRVNDSVQSGTLTVNGARIDTFLNFGFLRTSLYAPSPLLKAMIMLTCVTVLAGLALVLFGNVKEHILYLVLAAGFGIVTLFDLTPLYGFDMKFQFDSTYVLSNELLGMEGAIYGPSETDPDRLVVHYYRRNCDDYSLYQFYSLDSVSDNYTDMIAAGKDLRPAEEKQERKLVESAQGFISEQLQILYVPQAIGFAVARLLGLGFIPMIQLGRLAAYGVFVLLVFFAIRSMPFGKRLMLILALVPAVLTQTVSISRDATILGMSFFVIAKVLQMAYADRKPTVWDWGVMLAGSALLAPCKAVYLPVSFFWLLIIYRRDIYGQKADWPRIILRVVCCCIPILLVMSAMSSVSVFGMLSQIVKRFLPAEPAATAVQTAAETVAVSAPATYTFSYLLSDLPLALMLFVNTLRQQVGTYLTNGIQLFAIELGSGDTMTVLILILLLLESCRVDKKRELLRPAERYFALLVFVGVFLLLTLASMQWTAVGNYTIDGLQGRYLTPVFPLMGVFLMNNRIVRIQGASETFVKACCCVFPAIYLMNMYLWTISK